MEWRVARSLNVLLAQLNTMAPQRSRVSDGAIGDTFHADRTSDHNPWWGPGVVTARDFTHDPAGGLDCNWLAGALVASRDHRIKYVIWNRRILSGAGGPSPWVWRTYSGANTHTHHLHLSVVASPACDETQPWNLGATEENEMNTAQDTALAQTWGAVVDGRNWQGSNLQRQLGYVVSQIQAVGVAVAAAASGGQLDAEALTARLELATREAAAEAAHQAIVTTVVPALRDIVTEVLGDDNAEQADAIVDALAARLLTSEGTSK